MADAARGQFTGHVGENQEYYISLEYTNDFTPYFIHKSVISCNKSENSKEKINDTYVPAQTNYSTPLSTSRFNVQS